MVSRAEKKDLRHGLGRCWRILLLVVQYTLLMLTNQQIGEFIAEHRLPDRFSDLIHKYYSPLAAWVKRQHNPNETLFVGISGAQGTGKTTLADYLCLALEANAGWQVAALSMDDFYLTRSERNQLGESTHALLASRGVPGTHDMRMLANCIERLGMLGAGMSMPLPRFDKAQDDRSSPDSWPEVTGPVDVIILEGWCVGSAPQPGNTLVQPINLLEHEKDTDGAWRRYVNDQLRGTYASLFARLDKLIFLKAPNYDSVYRWRFEQERKLAAVNSDKATNIMDTQQLEQFMQHFERLTRANLARLPAVANVVIALDDNHDCIRCKFAE